MDGVYNISNYCKGFGHRCNVDSVRLSAKAQKGKIQYWDIAGGDGPEHATWRSVGSVVSGVMLIAAV